MAKRKLTGREKKQIEYAIAKNSNKDKNKMSAQDSIPFQRMYPDGICRMDEKTYSKTIRFSDINYMLNTNEDKSAIFDGWCDYLNYFDSSIKFQLSFINRSASRDNAAQSINIPCRAMNLTPSAPNTRKCCGISLPKATTA